MYWCSVWFYLNGTRGKSSFELISLVSWLGWFLKPSLNWSPNSLAHTSAELSRDCETSCQLTLMSVLLATQVSKMCDAHRWAADDGKMPKNTDCPDCWLPFARQRSYSERGMFMPIIHFTLYIQFVFVVVVELALIHAGVGTLISTEGTLRIGVVKYLSTHL